MGLGIFWPWTLMVKSGRGGIQPAKMAADNAATASNS